MVYDPLPLERPDLSPPTRSLSLALSPIELSSRVELMPGTAGACGRREGPRQAAAGFSHEHLLSLFTLSHTRSTMPASRSLSPLSRFMLAPESGIKPISREGAGGQ